MRSVSVDRYTGKVRAAAGRRLRRLADSVDPEGSMALSGLSFTFEPGRGYVQHGEPGVHHIWPPEAREPGCPLLYDRREYRRAHDDAGLA